MSDNYFTSPAKTFKSEPTKTISSGLSISQNAVLKIDKRVDGGFMLMLQNYMRRGLVRIETVHVVDIPTPTKCYWGA